jgi:cytidylate kinase
MNILQKYLEERHQENEQKKKEYDEPGPVVTISRESGCSGRYLADKLATRLNQQNFGETAKGKWSVLSKEILEHSAKELELQPSQIEYVFKYEKKSAIDEILGALSSKYYKSDRKIRNTIKKVIYTFGVKGNAIILGRGGESITKDIKRSFHIRLIAPLNWRVEVINKRFDFDNKQAREYVLDIDKKRKELQNDMAGKEVDDTNYDVIFNAKSFSGEEMVDLIIQMMKMRSLI